MFGIRNRKRPVKWHAPPVEEENDRGRGPAASDVERANDTGRMVYAARWFRVPRYWNKILLATSVMSAFIVDPLFLYIAVCDNKKKCFGVDRGLAIALITLRSALDLCYWYDVFMQFKHQSKCSGFLAIVCALPFLQVLSLTKVNLSWVFIPQLLVRCTKLFMYSVTQTFPGHGAEVSLLLFVLSSNALGAVWYNSTLMTLRDCWKIACARNRRDLSGLFCGFKRTGDYSFLNSSCPLLEPNEIKQPSDYNFGMFLDALQLGTLLEEKNRMQRMLYALWWGLQNFSSAAEHIRTSSSIYQTLFAIFILIAGLFLTVLVIYAIQNLVGSFLAYNKTGIEINEEIHTTERWMSSHNLPEELKQRIRDTGIDIIKDRAGLLKFSPELRRDFIRHECQKMLNHVPMFQQLDEWANNALFDLIKPASFTNNTYIFLEGKPVDKFLFLTGGELLSTSIGDDGKRNSQTIHIHQSNGYLLGKELITTWASDTTPNLPLPTSTTTIQSVRAVEGYQLTPNHLTFLADQHLRLTHFDSRSEQENEGGQQPENPAETSRSEQGIELAKVPTSTASTSGSDNPAGTSRP